MRSSDKIVHFLSENRGADYCDPCLVESLTIESLREVENIVSTLELFPEYLRVPGTCHRCGRTDLLVIHAV